MDTQVPQSLRLELFGHFAMSRAAGTEEVIPRKMVRAMIALLVLAPPAGWPREQLAAMLWADRDPEQARASLRQALTELRRSFGEACLATDRDTICFVPRCVTSDVSEFLHFIAKDRVREAAELYRGELLEGVSLPAGPFDDWLLVERARFHELAVGVLERLMQQQSGKAWESAARRLLQLEPCREETHRALMRHFAGQGSRSLAIHQYQVCRDSLQRELGVKPEPETERLYLEIQSGLKLAFPAAAMPDAAAVAPAGHQHGLKPGRFHTAIAAILALVACIGVAGFLWKGGTPAQKPVVAVLPFDDMTGNESAARLARGLTEDIITDLARIPEFKVLARNATEAYSGKHPDAKAAGSALKAQYIVQGAIQHQADRVRISAQLFDAATGNGLWSQRWDRPAADVFAIQSEIAEHIANRLGGGNGLIQEAGRIAAHRKPPSSLTAYDMYLLGTEKLEQISRGDVEESIRLLRRAIEIDPGLARAWVELSNAYSVLANFGADMEANYKLCIEAAERAVLLDPSDAEAQAVYAISFGYRNDLARAKKEFDIALRMAPNQFEILAFYIAWASSFGEAERGAKLVDEAIELNPNYPMWSAKTFAYAYFMTGRYQDTIAMMERLKPENYGTWLWPYRAGALAALGREAEAKAAVKQALALFPSITIEGTANEPGYSEAEQTRLISTMRLAGFPPCAGPEALAKIDKPLRLRECGGEL